MTKALQNTNEDTYARIMLWFYLGLPIQTRDPKTQAGWFNLRFESVDECQAYLDQDFKIRNYRYWYRLKPR